MTRETTILRIADVAARIGLGATTIKRMVRADQFPRPVRLTARAVGWRSEDVQQWLDARVSTSSGNPHQREA